MFFEEGKLLFHCFLLVWLIFGRTDYILFFPRDDFHILIFRFADRFTGHLKFLLIVFMAFSLFAILLIYYVFTRVIGFNKGLVYVLFSLSGFFLNGTIPLFYELGVELTYPVAEGITSGSVMFFNNFLQSIFLVVPLGHLGTKWMLWATIGTCAASTLLLVFVKETYNRSSVDKRAKIENDFSSSSLNM